MGDTQEDIFQSYYDSRFIDDYLGAKLASDPVTAIVELIANSWDAGAKNVNIEWPVAEGQIFSISDDGHGLTLDEFKARWTCLSYNRQKSQGDNVEIPEDNKVVKARKAYGRNGKGRFSTFCFNLDTYYVETKKSGEHNCFRVRKAIGAEPLKYEKSDIPTPSKLTHNDHGTAVFTILSGHNGTAEERVRSEIGLRFLTDPDFTVVLNGKKVAFNDIDPAHITTLGFIFNSKPVEIIAVNTEKSDKTTQRHGVAWHVNSRLVGQSSWEGFRSDNILDGRTSLAKRYTFIVKADLMELKVKPDWSGFNSDEELQFFYDCAKEKILSFVTELSVERRGERKKELLDSNRNNLSVVGLAGVERWLSFVDEVQVKCPSITDDELSSVAGILAKLEASTSQYSLIHTLAEYTSSDFDDLSSVLNDWNIKSAKAVLDEIRSRLTLIAEIRNKVHKKSTLEVQELQPLFGKGLWIFGPEFESIEFTSNQGMTAILNTLFKISASGSLNRPDFVVLPDSSIGLYGRFAYDDEDGHERGVDKVIIVELKRPGVRLGSDEKQQCWKYVKELYAKGALLPSAKVQCFLLGEQIENGESSIFTEKDGDVRIAPFVYDTIIKRAESRMLNLHKLVESSPFVEQNLIQKYIAENVISPQEQLSLKSSAA